MILNSLLRRFYINTLQRTFINNINSRNAKNPTPMIDIKPRLNTRSEE